MKFHWHTVAVAFEINGRGSWTVAHLMSTLGPSISISLIFCSYNAGLIFQVVTSGQRKLMGLCITRYYCSSFYPIYLIFQVGTLFWISITGTTLEQLTLWCNLFIHINCAKQTHYSVKCGSVRVVLEVLRIILSWSWSQNALRIYTKYYNIDDPVASLNLLHRYIILFLIIWFFIYPFFHHCNSIVSIYFDHLETRYLPSR
jgi:hypothetical protein